MSVRSSQPSKRGVGQSQPMGGQRSNNLTSSSSASVSSSPSVSSFQSPLVLTPVSQLGNVPRRNSRAFTRPESDVKGMSFDPEYYNPDGSLRTMHKLPSNDQSWAQAKNARYVRHTREMEREKELSVKEIFGHKK